MNNELFTSICNGDIQNSILLTTKMIFLQDTTESLEIVFVDICAYIGSFISIIHISKLIDIYSILTKIIESDKIVIKELYILVTKMCILCDLYNKHPISKCGTMTIATLKSKVAGILNSSDMKLSANGIMRFDGVLPPHNHENYHIALSIVAVFIKTIKSADDISVDDRDKIVEISNNTRFVIDYIIRKKYRFETKFYSSDDDITWFLWGVFSILYDEPAFKDAFALYNYEFKKKYRQKRIGLIWSLGIISIYTHKRDISSGWSHKELIVIQKIDDIAIKLYNELRRDIMKEYPDMFENARRNKNKDDVDKNDGMDFILKYVPELDSNKLQDTQSAYNLYPKSMNAKSVEGVNTNDKSRIILY
jgi:hypothetical protein